ncbi:hypothetical protein BDN70DRAFT_938870 [Pholiota conissans]|uniref:Transmembrane protein n=1 Tax=Pholiota conissans TaxID=109636 RepID=A0A9P5YKJ5_9AGAR|nr:hypothetical protein BDN70DRAFT_938870 [Pholiota conissans]
MSNRNATAFHHGTILQAGYVVDDENSVVAANLNSSMFMALSMGSVYPHPKNTVHRSEAYITGIYTVVFGGTLYAYLTRHPSKRSLVPITVSILYMSNLAVFGIQWYTTKSQFIDNDQSRATIFLATIEGDQRLDVGVDIGNAISVVLSDALLIWRCFNVWGHSIRVVSIPIFLTITEAVLMFTGAIAVATLPPSANSLKIQMISVTSAGVLMSACTTIITTVLITFRIHSFLRLQDVSSRKFWHIIDIVVQSGAVYSLSLGMSTTLMVARVATLSDDTNISTSVHLTGIQFKPRSTACTTVGAVSVPLYMHMCSDSAAAGDTAAEVKDTQVPTWKKKCGEDV